MSYFAAVSNSNPQIWWRMNNTGTVVQNSGTDATFSAVSATIIANAANRLTGTTAAYWSPVYFPHADISGALEQSYYSTALSTNAVNCSSSANSVLTGVFDMFATGSPGLTVEWLMRHKPGGPYANVGSIWSWVNSSGHNGIRMQIQNWPECTDYHCVISWTSGASTQQNLDLGWGTTNSTYYAKPPGYGYESNASQTPSGSFGPHNGWHHYAMTLSSGVALGGGGLGNFSLYVDGLQYEIDYAAGTNPPPSGARDVFTDQKLYIGGTPTNYPYAWQYIAEFAAYSRSLSTVEIQTHWAEIAKWNSNISASYINLTGSLLYSVQAPAGNVNYVPSSAGTGNDPRATKTNPGAN